MRRRAQERMASESQNSFGGPVTCENDNNKEMNQITQHVDIFDVTCEQVVWTIEQENKRRMCVTIRTILHYGQTKNSPSTTMVAGHSKG